MYAKKLKNFLWTRRLYWKTTYQFQSNKSNYNTEPQSKQSYNNTITTAIDNDIPWRFNNPVKLPSVIPKPPGRKDNAPKNNDEAYVEAISAKPNESMLRAFKTYNTAKEIVNQYNADRIIAGLKILALVEAFKISWDLNNGSMNFLVNLNFDNMIIDLSNVIFEENKIKIIIDKISPARTIIPICGKYKIPIDDAITAPKRS